MQISERYDYHRISWLRWFPSQRANDTKSVLHLRPHDVSSIGRHFANDSFQWISSAKNICLLITILGRFVPVTIISSGEGLTLSRQGIYYNDVYNDVKMSAMAFQITSLTIVYSTVYSRRRWKKTSKLRVTGLCEGNSPVTGEFPAQRPLTRKMFPFDGVIVYLKKSWPSHT